MQWGLWNSAGTQCFFCPFGPSNSEMCSGTYNVGFTCILSKHRAVPDLALYCKDSINLCVSANKVTLYKNITIYTIASTGKRRNKAIFWHFIYQFHKSIWYITYNMLLLFWNFISFLLILEPQLSKALRGLDRKKEWKQIRENTASIRSGRIHF